MRLSAGQILDLFGKFLGLLGVFYEGDRQDGIGIRGLIFLQEDRNKPIELIEVGSQEFLILRAQYTGTDVPGCARERAPGSALGGVGRGGGYCAPPLERKFGDDKRPAAPARPKRSSRRDSSMTCLRFSRRAATLPGNAISNMTAFRSALLQIPLMILFRPPERFGGRNFRGDRMAEFSAGFQRLL